MAVCEGLSAEEILTSKGIPVAVSPLVGLRPPGHHLASKPRFRTAPNFFGQMRAKRCDNRRCAMCIASAVGLLAIEIVGMVGDTRHLYSSVIECPGCKPR